MWRHDDSRTGAVLVVLVVQSSRQGRPVERLQLRVEAAAGGELSTQDGVLKQQRGQQGGRDREELRAQVLDLPLQLHPPVLEPCFHLRNTRQTLTNALYAQL